MDRAALITSNPQTNFTSTLIPQSDKPIAQTDFINEIWDYLTGKSSSDLFKLFSVAILISLWIFYITLINSHLFGWLLTQFLNHFLLRFVWGTDAYFKVSAISVSILTGRIVIRDLRFVTPDFRVRVCDGVFVFKWWRTYRRRKGTWCTDMRLLWYRHIVRKPLPDNLVSAVNARTSLSEPSSARPNSRASIHLYGFDIHFINRTQVYSRLIHFFNLEDSRWNLKEQDTLSPCVKLNLVLIILFFFCPTCLINHCLVLLKLPRHQTASSQQAGLAPSGAAYMPGLLISLLGNSVNFFRWWNAVFARYECDSWW